MREGVTFPCPLPRRLQSSNERDNTFTPVIVRSLQTVAGDLSVSDYETLSTVLLQTLCDTIEQLRSDLERAQAELTTALSPDKAIADAFLALSGKLNQFLHAEPWHLPQFLGLEGDQVHALLIAGPKIEAIKEIRKSLHLGLMESKEIYEAFRRNRGAE